MRAKRNRGFENRKYESNDLSTSTSIWAGYRHQFAQLQGAGSELQLCLEFGEGAEDWYLTSESQALKDGFLAISRQAGKALADTHLSNHETGALVDPEIRWFRLLRERNQPRVVSPVVIDNHGVALSKWQLDDGLFGSMAICHELEHGNQPSSVISDMINRYKADPIGISVKVLGSAALAMLLVRLALR